MGDLFLLSRVQMRRIERYFPLSNGIARVDDSADRRAGARHQTSASGSRAVDYRANNDCLKSRTEPFGKSSTNERYLRILVKNSNFCVDQIRKTAGSLEGKFLGVRRTDWVCRL